jgi:peptidoglycan/xylan/chitin deacetylase (PgdA/CDA1 family)
MRSITRQPLATPIVGVVVLIGLLAFAWHRDRVESTSAGKAEFPLSGAIIDRTDAGAAMATSSEKISVPIVVFHIVRPSYASDSQSVRDMAVTPETFDADMKHLSDAGYHVVTFADLKAYFESGTPLAANPIIISFDDGWRDQFDYGFPILLKYRYPATFFVFTNAVGRPGFVSWDDLRELLSAGMTVGSHSRSHPFLTKISDPATLWDEISGSKDILEKNLGTSVDEFAYPFGRFDATTTAMVKKAGYALARGDLYYGYEQRKSERYDLSALNAPTTAELFARAFPSKVSGLK